MPSPMIPPQHDAHGNFEANLLVPITRWLVVATCRDEASLGGDLKGKPSYFMCLNRSTLTRKPSATQAKT